LLNNDTIKDNLKKTGLVTKAYVTHNILGGVSIEIQEATLVAYMELDNKTYVVTEEGKLIQVVEGMNYTGLKQIPKISGFTDIKAVEELASQYAVIPVTIRNAVSDIVYSPEKGYDDRVALILDDGKKLIVDIQGMKDTLSPSRFDYSAYMQSKNDVCVFSFEGRNLYMTKCE
jgi:Cell division septal protein